MVGGVQAKVLLSQNEDGTLELDKTFEATKILEILCLNIKM